MEIKRIIFFNCFIRARINLIDSWHYSAVSLCLYFSNIIGKLVLLRQLCLARFVHLLQVLADLVGLVGAERVPKYVHNRLREEKDPILMACLVENLEEKRPYFIDVWLHHFPADRYQTLAPDYAMRANHKQDSHLVALAAAQFFGDAKRTAKEKALLCQTLGAYTLIDVESQCIFLEVPPKHAN